MTALGPCLGTCHTIPATASTRHLSVFQILRIQYFLGSFVTFVAMLLPSTPRDERVLATIRDIPGPIYAARRGMLADELARIRAAMASFTPSQP